MMEPVEIGLILYPGVQESALLGLCDMFEVANVLAPAGRGKMSTSRWVLDQDTGELKREKGGDNFSTPAVLLVAPGKAPPLAPEVAAPFGKVLRTFHAAGGTLASVCVGAFLLAESGLLDGRTATTHFAFQGEFRTRFPRIRLAIDQLVVDDGDIITAGGMMAWTDLGLKLVDRFLGSTIMLETARILLIDPPGRAQSYYGTFVPLLGHGDAGILAAQHWIHAAYANDIPVRAMAAKAGLGERTFLRKFNKATGMTSTDYLQHVRVNRAREILQFSPSSVDDVAWKVGYSDAGAFRKVFTRIVGLSPTAYRRRYHA